MSVTDTSVYEKQDYKVLPRARCPQQEDYWSLPSVRPSRATSCAWTRGKTLQPYSSQVHHKLPRPPPPDLLLLLLLLPTTSPWREPLILAMWKQTNPHGACVEASRQMKFTDPLPQSAPALVPAEVPRAWVTAASPRQQGLKFESGARPRSTHKASCRPVLVLEVGSCRDAVAGLCHVRLRVSSCRPCQHQRDP